MSPKTKRVTKRPKRVSSTTNDSFKRAFVFDAFDPLGFHWHPGQPSKYRPEFCQLIVRYARDGRTFEEFASDHGIHRDTLHEWGRKHKEFSDSYRKAKQEAELYMINLGKKALLEQPIGVDVEEYEDSKGKKQIREKKRFLNVGVWKYFLACRFGWREDTPVTGDDDGDLEWEYEDE